MDLLEDLRALVLVAEHKSFSLAARRIGTSPSVMIKRANAAEWRLKVQVLKRTTRRVTLTDAGQQVMPRLQTLVQDFDALLASLGQENLEATGFIRVKVPSELSAPFGSMLSRFLRKHRGVRMEVARLNRAVNPEAEGFDLAIDIQSLTFPNVTEIPLFNLELVLCAAPSYLSSHEPLTHPRELQKHRTLALEVLGKKWSFRGRDRNLTVDVSPRLLSADADGMLDAAINGAGIALLPAYLIEEALRANRLLPVMNEYAPVEAWATALVPDSKLNVPRVRSLIDWLRERQTLHGADA
ncbi:LysR family transcriptional regulator [Trinickia diaoshuihuensis]|uniref:LysR family transcriptional regulator n=1 Tax=Trinickia diaoshuihuensis TaxID=2292265 RepID=UPI000E251EB1|nr:LysR family transcriptional regulator [Trinickia diaoshuihuensis]